eukprot:UC1_evm1s1743
MSIEEQARKTLTDLASKHGLDVKAGKILRTSSRFCLSVEHGDYNGTELFGVGTDRFIWLAYKPNGTDRVRIASQNFPDDGVVDFQLGQYPAPLSPEVFETWARFPYGTNYVLDKAGYAVTKGFDAVVYGNIPGGGMSRSASLSINLVLTMCDVNGIDLGSKLEDKFTIVDLSQAVETNYVGSPCGQLDQIMILFAKDGHGTHYDPKAKTIKYVPLGEGASDFYIMALDTGTMRPGLEKSTYKVRRQECDDFAAIAGRAFGFETLADVNDQALFDKVIAKFGESHPDHCDRLRYVFSAQKRFYEMMEAWKAGNIERVGEIFREDGRGLRDVYKISGPELESMCDIVRSVPGVLGERMLGGGDKGAAGALVRADAVDAVRAAVEVGYARSRPDFEPAVHAVKIVDGVQEQPGL